LRQRKGAPGLFGWEWFNTFGLLRRMNGSEGLCSEVILEDSGRWSGLFYDGEKRHMHSVRGMHRDESFTGDKSRDQLQAKNR